MSKYTTEVRFICENAAGLTESAGYSRIDDILNKAVPSVFSFDFPIFDERYRNVLCKKILKHYYTREICEETVGLWKFRLDTRMNEIMPYYNQLYKSELLEFNPLYDVDLTRSGNKESTAKDNESLESSRTGTGNTETDATNDTNTSSTRKETAESTSNGTNTSTSNGTNTSTTNGTNKSTTSSTNESTNKETNVSTASTESSENKTERDLYSDTPQGALNNVENETYLTNARKKMGEGTKTDSGNSSGETNISVSGEDSSTTNGENSNTTTGEDTNTTTGEMTNTTSGEVDASATGETKHVGNTVTNYTNNDAFNSNQIKNAESTEDYLEKVQGKQSGGSYSKMLMEYRQTFLNIDMQVIESLSDLFFGLW